VTPLLDLEASGQSEWTHPKTASEADGGSQVRLQASLVAVCIYLANLKWDATTHMEERKIKEQFEMYQRTGILLASLMRAEQGR
jgi:hypothetical protein